SRVFSTTLMGLTGAYESFAFMVLSGVFERFPRLKCIILETGSAWIPHLLRRMDDRWKLYKWGLPAYTPTELFQRHWWVSADPDEEMIPFVADFIGADRIIWASDFPHPDAQLDTVKTLRENIKTLPGDAQRKILGENAAKVFNLPM